MNNVDRLRETQQHIGVAIPFGHDPACRCLPSMMTNSAHRDASCTTAHSELHGRLQNDGQRCLVHLADRWPPVDLKLTLFVDQAALAYNGHPATTADGRLQSSI